MADYKESEITGKKWTRCCVVTIDNTKGQVPKIDFREQVVEIVAGQEKITPAGNVFVDFNPTNVIPLINPDTLEPTGETVPELSVYLALFSRYIQAAKARDEAQAGS